MFWRGLVELVNSLYEDLGPILVVGNCKSCEFALFRDRVDFEDFRIGTRDKPVVLILRTVRRIDLIFRDRHRTLVFDANAATVGLPRTNSLSGGLPMPIVEAVRLFPAPFLWHRSSTPKGLATVPPG